MTLRTKYNEIVMNQRSQMRAIRHLLFQILDQGFFPSRKQMFNEINKQFIENNISPIEPQILFKLMNGSVQNPRFEADTISLLILFCEEYLPKDQVDHIFQNPPKESLKSGTTISLKIKLNSLGATLIKTGLISFEKIEEIARQAAQEAIHKEIARQLENHLAEYTEQVITPP